MDKNKTSTMAAPAPAEGEALELVKDKELVIALPAPEQIGIALPDLEALKPYVQRALFMFPAIAHKLSENEAGWKGPLFLSLYECLQRGVNPFKRQSYLVPYASRGGNTITVQIAIDELLRRLYRNPRVSHVNDGELVLYDGKTNKVERSKGCIVAPGWNILGGVATVYFRDDTAPEEYSVSLKQYASQSQNWADVGFMLLKCARAHAARTIAPEECGGFYVAGELPSEGMLEPAAGPSKPKALAKVSEVRENKLRQLRKDVLDSAKLIADMHNVRQSCPVELRRLDQVDAVLIRCSGHIKDSGITSTELVGIADEADLRAILAKLQALEMQQPPQPPDIETGAGTGEATDETDDNDPKEDNDDNEKLF